MPQGTNLPMDLAGEQEMLARRRQMMAAMLQQASAPQQGQMVSGHYVAPSPLSHLAPLIGAIAGQRANEDFDAQAKTLGEQYNNRLASGLKNYFETREGSSGVPMGPPTEAGDMGPNTGAVPGDPRRAAIEAITSGIAPLQQLGQSDLSTLGKGALTPKDYLGLSGYDPRSRLAAAMSGNMGVLKPELKTHVVGDRIFEGLPGEGYTPTADARPSYGPVGTIGTGEGGEPIYGQQEKTTGKAAFAPKGVKVSVDTGTKAGDKFATELAGKRAEILTKSYDTAMSAQKALDAMGSAEQDMAAGMKSGLTAEIGLGIAKFAKAFGIDADPTIANTEAFRSNMARETLNLVKGLGAGTGISNADREFAEKASGGSILLDDKAMVRLINVAKAAAGNVLFAHNDLINSNMDASGALPGDLETFRIHSEINGGPGVQYDPGTKRLVPAAPSNTPTRRPVPGTISVEDWLKR